jgi:uncharacterized protein (TIGR03437 family)
VIHRPFRRTAFVFLIGAASIFPPALCQAQTPAGYTITTYAGNNIAGFSGDAGAASSAELNFPYGVAVDTAGNLYIADQLNHRIRKVAVDGSISTVAGNGTAGYSGDAASATGAELYAPSGVAVDSSGNLYIADTSNCVIRKVSGTTITTYAGSNINYATSCGPGGDHGLATNAQLFSPTGVALDAAGNLYIADTGNSLIRVVAKSNQYITSLSTTAILKSPRGVAVDATGSVYIADTGNSRILKVTPNASTTVTTIVAGNGVVGFSGDGGPATSAQLNSPSAVALDSAGNIYVADTNNNRVRRVTADGIITAIAGIARSGYSGDQGPATSAQLSFPRGVAVNASGKVYIADNQNSVIRLLTPPVLPSINPGGVITASAFGAFRSIAPGAFIEIYGTNLASGSGDWSNSFNGVNAPTALLGTSVTIGGQAAFIAYVSPGQVNGQVPSNVATGQQQITVTTAAGTSAPYAVTVNPTAAGMLAPASFKIGGVQYVAAMFPDYQTFVLPPGAIPGVASRQAKPGETIIIFGIGFGPVIPNIPAGQLVQQDNQLATVPFQISFASTPATLAYWGLARTFSGLYQFNVVVPNIAPSDAVPLTFTLGGVSGTQTLYTAVGQ